MFLIIDITAAKYFSGMKHGLAIWTAEKSAAMKIPTYKEACRWIGSGHVEDGRIIEE